MAEAGTGVGDEGAGVADGEVDQPVSSFRISMSGLISDCCGLLQVNRATDSGIASLSGAGAWASDSESLFVEPSGPCSPGELARVAAVLAGRAGSCRGRARRASWVVLRPSLPATRPATWPCSPGELVRVTAVLARVTAVFAGASTGNTAVFAGRAGSCRDRSRRMIRFSWFLPAGILGTGVPSSGVLPEDTELWASDDVLETVEPGALMFPKEGLHLRKMNPEPLSFLSSIMGGRARPRRPLTDPFSSPVPSWGNIPKADSEAVPIAPLRRLLGMRSPTEFERAPDGGAGEVAVYEAYLEAGFRGAFPSLIGEVSSFFGFSPSQLTPLTWRTLMALQVLGKLYGFSIGVHEILYSYYFASLANKDGFYHLRSRDSAPLVEEPSRGVRGNRTFGDGWNSRYVFVKIQEPVGYPTSWRTVDISRPVSFAREAVAKLIMGMPRRFRWVTFLVSRETLRHSHVWGNAVRSPVSVIYDEYQKVKARKWRLSYIPTPRLARVALSAESLPSISSTSAEIMPNWDPLADAHQRLTREALLFRGQVQDMMACRDLLIQQVRALARWELMKEWLEKRVDHWNPEEEYRRHLFLSGGFNHRSEYLSQAATPRSVIRSQFLEGPSF
ncbi:hypothetical protein F2Q69_00031269 [Brassica cretica]|uniref:Uncharacterized protein n=1 Tax=Brassica cretica TaxID=69181 RepID=A0A8S9S4W1_BRACR|nr:hypothetical protein F2Q69_00031269 [Brassica cretica]